MRHKAVWGLLVMFVLTFAGTAVAQQPQEKKVGSFTLIKTADKMTDEDRSRAITFGEDQKGALTWICLEDGGRLARSHDDDRGRGDDGAVAEGRGLDDQRRELLRLRAELVS